MEISLSKQEEFEQLSYLSISRNEGIRLSGEQFLESSIDEDRNVEEQVPEPTGRERKRRMNRLAIWLAILTLLSTFWAGVTNWAPSNACFHAADVGSLLPIRMIVLANWWGGLQFSLALMGILAAHEFGHYLFTIYYRVPSTPPLFIPFPISSIGTCGAVIAMQGGEADRRQIFDIGLAGPLAGLVVAIPILYWAMIHPEPMEYGPYRMMSIGHPLLIQWMASGLYRTRRKNTSRS